MDGGDLILSEVVQPLGRPRTDDDRALLVEAQLLRAVLYERSGGATPLEAAEALDDAFAAQVGLEPDPHRSRRIGKCARALLPALEAIGSRRTVVRLVRIVLETHDDEASAPSSQLLRTLNDLPRLVRRLRDVADDPGVTELLYAASRFANVESARDAVRDTRREGTRHLLSLGEARDALTLERTHKVLGPAERERLALLLADEGHLDREASGFFQEVLSAQPETRDRLSMSLRRLTHVGTRAVPEDLDAKERLSRELLRWFATEDWPYRNLAAVAAHRGRPELAIAWFAAALDHGGEGADVAGLVAASLCELGFDRVAEALVLAGGSGGGSDLPATIRTLARADRALEEEADGDEVDVLTRVLAHLASCLQHHKGLLARTWSLRGRLLQVARRTDEAAQDMERALAIRQHDQRLAADLAECCIALGQEGRAQGLIDLAERERRTRRTLLLRADAAEAQSRDEETLQRLEEALLVPDVATGPRRELRASCDRVCKTYEKLQLGKSRDSAFLRQLRKECQGKETGTVRRCTRPHAVRQRVAEVARRLGQPTRELELLLPLAQRGGASRRRVLRTARVALRAGDPAVARDLVERMSRRKRGDAAVQALEGLLALQEGRAADARRRLGAARDGGADDPATGLALALAALMEGDAEAALAALTSLPEDLPVLWRLRSLDLRALAYERTGSFEDALAARSEAVALDEDPARRVALGRLSLALGLRSAPSPTTRERLELGVRVLADATDAESRALRALGDLALGREPAGALALLAPDADGTTIQIGASIVALGHTMVSRRLRAGDIEGASELAETLVGPSAELIRERIRTFGALRRLETLGDAADPDTLACIAEDLAGAEPSPTVHAARDLVAGLRDSPEPRHLDTDTLTDLTDVPVGLRLALAHLAVARGQDLDRMRSLLEPVAETGGRGAPEARVLLAVLEPDRARLSVEHPLLASRDGAFPFLDPATARALERRGAFLYEGLAPARAIASGDGPIHRAVDAAATIDDVRNAAKDGAAPSELARGCAHVVMLAGHVADVRSSVDTACRALESAVNPAGADHVAARDALEAARHADAADDPRAVLLHRRAHDAWARFFARPDWRDAIPETDAGTVAAFSRDLVEAQAARALELVDHAPHLAAVYLRLYLESPLAHDPADVRRERILGWLVNSLDEDTEAGRARHRLTALLHAAPDHAAASRRLASLVERHPVQLTSASPPRERLDHARRLSVTGEFAAAVQWLDGLYADLAGTDDAQLLRETVELLNVVRDAQAAGRAQLRQGVVADAFSSGRWREVLDATGGKAADATLDPALATLRVRALISLRHADRAAYELDLLIARSTQEGFAIEAGADLETEVALLDVIRRLRDAWTDVLRLWSEHEDLLLLDHLEDLQSRFPVEPGIPFVRALVHHRQGDFLAAATAAESATTLADALPSCRLRGLAHRLLEPAT
ncbi:MAG: hypothetical protein CMJ83_11570 [Planctomycetes bacterium]|nr:hypothetical protein [Planctomycetota bacterium]